MMSEEEEEEETRSSSAAGPRRDADDPPRVVRLNVGGVVFETTRGTLEKCGYLRAVLSGNWRPQVDASDAVFVDRDPRHFAVILRHLRGSLHAVAIEALDVTTRLELVDEATYYDVRDLVPRLVVPPVGAVVRYSYVAPQREGGDRGHNLLRDRVLCCGVVEDYAHHDRAWTVRVRGEGKIAMEQTMPAKLHSTAQPRRDVFRWDASALDAQCIVMPFETETSHGLKLQPFGDDSVPWQWLTQDGRWTSASRINFACAGRTIYTSNSPALVHAPHTRAIDLEIPPPTPFVDYVNRNNGDA